MVPIVAVNRHPVFPKFIKIVEVNEPKLIEIIRRKVKLNQPYAGIFVKRSDENSEEVVASKEDLYPVGSFAQIVELQVSSQRRVREKYLLSTKNIVRTWARGCGWC